MTSNISANPKKARQQPALYRGFHKVQIQDMRAGEKVHPWMNIMLNECLEWGLTIRGDSKLDEERIAGREDPCCDREAPVVFPSR